MSDLFRFFHPHSIDAISKTLSDNECKRLNQFCLKRSKFIFHYEWFENIE